MSQLVGRTATGSHVVGPEDTAVAVGSGTVPVLGTPRLLAWLEHATVAAVATDLDEGATTVGIEVGLRHRRASALGSGVHVQARVDAHDGKVLTFTVTAAAPDGTVLAEGTVRRAIVDEGAFLSRA